MKGGILQHLRKRFITEFLDLIVLVRLKIDQYITAYDIINYIREKCNIICSPGTAYSTLYSMERKGLVKGEKTGRKRIYRITPRGEELVRVAKEKTRIMKSLFREFETEGDIETND